MWSRDTHSGALGSHLPAASRDDSAHGEGPTDARQSEPRLRNDPPEAHSRLLREGPDRRRPPVQGMLRGRFRAIYDGETLRMDGVPALAFVGKPGYADLCG